MSPLQLLWLLAALVFLMFGAGWLAMARLPGDIARRVRSLGLFNVVFAVGVALIAARGHAPDTLTHAGINLVQLLAFAIGWRAIDDLLLGRRNVEAAWLAGIGSALTVVLLLAGAPDDARIAVLHLTQVVFLVRVERCHSANTRERYGAKVARLLRLVCWGVAALLVARVVFLLVQGTPLSAVERLRPDTLGLVFMAVAAICTINGLAAYAVLANLYGELNRQTGLDVLTGLPNRRAMAAFVERHWRLWQRHGRPFSVLCIDIDHFKAVNDRHGHAAGDLVLCQVAQALRGALRSTDDLARQGGEEFTAFLPEGGPPDDAQATAERLRAAVRALVPPPGVTQRVTVSVGVSSVAQDDASADAVLARADGALYAAKAAGRDRVMVREPGGATHAPVPPAAATAVRPS